MRPNDPKDPKALHVTNLNGGRNFVIGCKNGSKKRVKTQGGWSKVKAFSASCLRPLLSRGLITFANYQQANEEVKNLHRT